MAPKHVSFGYSSFHFHDHLYSTTHETHSSRHPLAYAGAHPESQFVDSLQIFLARRLTRFRFFSHGGLLSSLSEQVFTLPLPQI